MRPWTRLMLRERECRVVNCKVCRKPILGDTDGAIIGAFGRPLFPVHREPCLGVVRTGAKGLILGALAGLRYVLGKKAPKALVLLEGTTRAVQQIRQERLNG